MLSRVLQKQRMHGVDRESLAMQGVRVSRICGAVDRPGSTGD